MRFPSLALLVLTLGCSTSTKMAPAPTAVWEHALDAAPELTEKTTAVVWDFRRGRTLGLSGRTQDWMRWLDERATGATIEALGNTGTSDRPMVKLRVGDVEQPCALDPKLSRSVLPPALVKPGLTLTLGETPFGPLDVDARDGACAIGLDVLSKTVLLVPRRERLPVWLMVTPE